MVLLVAALFAVFAAIAGPSLPGGGIARALADGLLCAVGSSDRCHGSEPGTAVSPTVAAYGHEIAAMLDRSAPDIFFEADDFVSLPVDFRDCRERRCADTVRAGSVHATQTGLPPVAFTHVIDCRRAPAPASRPAGGYDCSGARAGHVYLQYWLYYPDSLTHGLGRVGGFHLDDWESYQTRIDGDGSAAARASSHHGYNGRQGGIASIGSDTGWSPRSGVGPQPQHAARRVRQPRRDHRSRLRRQPGDPSRGPRPDPSRADRFVRGRRLRGLAAVAEGGLARPRGDGHLTRPHATFTGRFPAATAGRLTVSRRRRRQPIGRQLRSDWPRRGPARCCWSSSSATRSSTPSTPRSSARWPGTSATSPTSRSSGWSRPPAAVSP